MLPYAMNAEKRRMMTDPYASVADTYDLMIDWPSRLAREQPFFERLLSGRPVRRVLDVGCGTGHHSRMFASLGMEVVGLDPSAAMLERAQALTTGENPRYVQGGFVDIPQLPGTFELIVVLGNTLAYARDVDDLAEILRRMRQALSDDGHLCVQVVNYDNILRKESHWLPLIHRQIGEREFLFLREYRRIGQQVEFTIITLAKDGEWQRMVERSQHYAITGEALQHALQCAGFARWELYGNYAGDAYDPATSPSLVAVAANG